MAFILRKLATLFKNPNPRFILMSGCAIGCFGKSAFRNMLHTESEKTQMPNVAGKTLILGVVIEEDEPNKSNGLKIVTIKPNTVAEKCNLKEDDLIVEVDGIQVKTLDAYKTAIAKGESNMKIFKIIRNGVELKIEITFS